MFRKKLDAIFEQQKTRLIVASHDADKIEKAFQDLEKSEFGAAQIDTKCATELKHVLSKRYEMAIASTRLNGYGWTRAHVEDHMKRYLTNQLESAGHVVRESLGLS